MTAAPLSLFRWLSLSVVALCAASVPARADFQLCNRMSYVIDAAIGMEDKGIAITRGWFRLDPGQCRVVVPGEVQAESYYLHARTLPLYGSAPAPQAGS